MNVGYLKKLLEKYPDDMEVLNERCSDYCVVKEEEFYIVKGVPNIGWVMASHQTMSEENKRKEKEYLLIEGN